MSKSRNENLTLVEAYNFGLKYARKIDLKAELLNMNSVDEGEISGKDGKKSKWQLLITLPKKDQRLGLSLEKGQVIKKQFLKGSQSEYSVIKADDMKMNSDEAIKKAIDNYTLEPGGEQNNIFKGYHFKLIKEKEILFLTVVGDRTNNRLEIHYDAKKQKEIGRTEHSSI